MMKQRERVVSLILHIFYREDEFDNLIVLTNQYFIALRNLILTRGISFSVIYLKKVRLAVTRYISGHPLDSLDGVKIKLGWPVWASMLKSLLKKSSHIRFLLTLLTVLRDIQLKPILLTDPITNEWKGCLPDITRKEHLTICNELGITRKNVEWRRYHMSTKKGPTGQAIWTSVSELRALPPKLLDDITSIGGSPLRSHIDAIQRPTLDGYSMLDIWLTLFPHENFEKFRKLTYFSDKEGKTRVIGILDYWSQTALKRLHDTLCVILKNIRTDCTYDQGHFKSVLPQSQGIVYHSLDLTNATDRMPIILQMKVLGSIIGIKRAKAWRDILTEWSFPCDGQSYYYKTGQPMGAYSSWPAMALTHHYIVKLSALRAGFQNFWDYAILGDDVVIASAPVALEYQKVLTTLDIPLSVSKTHTSEIVYEFAKRWVYHGVEVTPFSLGGLFESWNKYPYLFNFLETQGQHGWGLPRERHPELIRRIYSIMGKHHQGVRVQKLYMLFGAISDVKKVGVFNSEPYRVLEQYFGFPHLSEERASSITDEVIRLARLQILQSDMETFQSGLYDGLMSINKRFSDCFPGLDAPAYRQLNRTHLPLIVTVNYKVDETDILYTIFDPDTPVEKILEFEGVRKYGVSRDIFFNLRESRAILLAFSRIVKLFITNVRDKLSNLQPP